MERQGQLLIRAARVEDCPDLLAIYNHYVIETHVSFDLQAQDLAQRESWFRRFEPESGHRLYVADEGQRVIGYACSTPFKSRPGYDISVETSVYLEPGATGRGIGRRLYGHLLRELDGSSLHGAYAGIALPNPASEALHVGLGFRKVGVLREVGRKFDRFWDVAWYERRISGEI